MSSPPCGTVIVAVGCVCGCDGGGALLTDVSFGVEVSEAEADEVVDETGEMAMTMGPCVRGVIVG